MTPTAVLRLLVVVVVAAQVAAWGMALPRGLFRKAVASVGVAAGLGVGQHAAQAFGPVQIPLKIVSYKEVSPLCNGQKTTMPGQKAMEGLYPSCIEVEASVVNPSPDTLKDVSVYGFVKENLAGNSVLPNNPDFKSDAGQYAMIKSVPPGESKVTFQFVVAIQQDTKKGEALPPLEFMKSKAVSMPGGNKFQALSECEIDPRSCDEDGDDE